MITGFTFSNPANPFSFYIVGIYNPTVVGSKITITAKLYNGATIVAMASVTHIKTTISVTPSAKTSSISADKAFNLATTSHKVTTDIDLANGQLVLIQLPDDNTICDYPANMVTSP